MTFFVSAACLAYLCHIRASLMDRHRATKNSPAYRADPCHNRRHDEPPVAVSRAADHLVAASSVSASSCQKAGSISVIVTLALFTMLISVMLTRARFFRGYSAKPIASVSPASVIANLYWT